VLYLLSTSLYSHLPLYSSVLFRISSTAAQCPATWRTTSAVSTTSRRLSSSRCPCGAQLFMYFILRFRNSWTDSWFGCNKIIHLRFILMLFVICVVISWWFCCIYAWLDPGAYMIARFMFFINRVWQITRSNQQDPFLFYPWNTIPLIFLPLSAVLTLDETKSVNLFCAYTETTHADFSFKRKSADFLMLCR
jgi:hypothetical protein